MTEWLTLYRYGNWDSEKWYDLSRVTASKWQRIGSLTPKSLLLTPKPHDCSVMMDESLFPLFPPPFGVGLTWLHLYYCNRFLVGSLDFALCDSTYILPLDYSLIKPCFYHVIPLLKILWPKVHDCQYPTWSPKMWDVNVQNLYQKETCPTNRQLEIMKVNLRFILEAEA